MTFKQLYFSYTGRIGRKAFWLKGVLPLAVAGIIGAIGVVGFVPTLGTLGNLDSAMTVGYSMMCQIVCLPFLLFLIPPALSIQVKRWHDRNKSGWWALIGLIPIIGPVWALAETGFLPKAKWWILVGLILITGSIWALVETDLLAESVWSIPIALILGLTLISGPIRALIETGFLKGTDGPNRFGAETF
jgi:uncharacterized membrane protein YhaH (DUF805 family)